MPRDKSDKRTTLVKAQVLRDSIEELDMDVGDLDKFTSRSEYSVRIKEIVELADMLVEEVDILLKCQYEMRKTIKSNNYA